MNNSHIISVKIDALDDDWLNDQKATGSAPPPSTKRVRRWTGMPKGKTPEEQDANIRKRKNFAHIISVAKHFRNKGIQPDQLECILDYLITYRSNMRLFPYRGRGFYYKQCFEVFCRDIKDYNRLVEMGLN